MLRFQPLKLHHLHNTELRSSVFIFFSWYSRSTLSAQTLNSRVETHQLYLTLFLLFDTLGTYIFSHTRTTLGRYLLSFRDMFFRNISQRLPIYKSLTAMLAQNFITTSFTHHHFLNYICLSLFMITL